MVYLPVFYYSPESPLVWTKYRLYKYGLTVFLNLNVFKPFHKEEDIKMSLSSTSTKTERQYFGYTNVTNISGILCPEKENDYRKHEK